VLSALELNIFYSGFFYKTEMKILVEQSTLIWTFIFVCIESLSLDGCRNVYLDLGSRKGVQVMWNNNNISFNNATFLNCIENNKQ